MEACRLTAYEFVLCHVSSGTDLEEACRIERVSFVRMVEELERNARLRRQWMMAEALWQAVQDERRG